MSLHIVDVHTPTSSFTVIHSLTRDSFESLLTKLAAKVRSEAHPKVVGAGWLKYEFNGTVWDLNDDSDYTVFAWRQGASVGESLADHDASQPVTAAHSSSTPTLHMHDPACALPAPPAYMNPTFYLFRLSLTQRSHASPAPSLSSKRSKRSKKEADEEKTPRFVRQFEKFHAENGVRTVVGSVGQVHNVRMLLKSGYRHVYMSRKFAQKHGFVPEDAAPGHYGYGGLVNIGTWPITLTETAFPEQPLEEPVRTETVTPSKIERAGSLRGHNNKLASGSAASTSRPSTPDNRGSRRRTSSLHSHTYSPPLLTSPPRPISKPAAVTPGEVRKSTTVQMQVYLAEEPHFDVVLGRSFFEKRQVKFSGLDQTEVRCMDTGERVECELVVLKDGFGQIVTVT